MPLWFVKQDYNAKLSDFGLAKDGPVGDKSHVSTRIMGTYGYAAPEYIMTGLLFNSSPFSLKQYSVQAIVSLFLPIVKIS